MSKENKEYGVDLEKEYKSLQKKINAVKNKITKRALFLKKKCPNVIIDDIKASECEVENYHITHQLDFIKKIESDYVSKSEQLDLFRNH